MTQLTQSLSRTDELRKALELDQIQPIILPPGIRHELADEDDSFRDWYEEELERLYDR